MGAPQTVGAILKGAHKTLDNANKFQSSTTAQAGNKSDPFDKSQASSPSDYSHVHEARKSGEFMGVKSDQGPELNAALKSREDAKTALQ